MGQFVITHGVEQCSLLKLNCYLQFTFPVWSLLDILYGVVKTHKQNYPMRPVLSAINTPEYNLAKWLEKQIKSCLIDTYSVSSSTEFVNKISNLEIKDQNIFASLDIKSLYTQVPLKEVIEDILETIYDKNSNSIFKESKITKIFYGKFYNYARKVYFYTTKKCINK